jgi:phosphoserine phosphatase
VFRSVVFDCDSTLSTIEGIDELASGHRAEIERLTEGAMRGELTLEAVYGRRLGIVRPTRAQVEALGQRYIETMVEDADTVVERLLAADIEVCVISGGLRPAVRAIAHELGLDDSRVAAVDIFFDAQGNYVGFDEGSPLARSGGKRDILAAWRELPRPVMLVGDGSTDLEAQPVVELFVAYTGVVERPNVVRGAGYVVSSRSLAPVFNIALGGHRPADPAAQSLWDKGAALLESRRRSDAPDVSA